MSEVSVTWVRGQQFVGTGTGGHSVVLDAPVGREQWEGFKPSDLLLAAVGGCTGVDVVEILRKKRQALGGLRIAVTGTQQEDPPYAFVVIDILYTVRGHGLSDDAVRQAIALSQEKYCSVAATVRGVAEIRTRFVIEDEE
jgi:putative redox protein